MSNYGPRISCPSGCGPVYDENVPLEQTTCRCGHGYFTREGTWVSGYHVRNGTEMSREEYYNQLGMTMPEPHRWPARELCPDCDGRRLENQSRTMPTATNTHQYSSTTYEPQAPYQSSSDMQHQTVGTSEPSYSDTTYASSMEPASYVSGDQQQPSTATHQHQYPYSHTSAVTQGYSAVGSANDLPSQRHSRGQREREHRRGRS